MTTLGPGTCLRLLLIEDSTSDSDLVIELLEEALPMARVDVAANLHDALRLLDEGSYDATLADLSLPDADGLTVVHAIRTSHPGTALLVLTGRADGQLALWALAEGAQDYLVKGQHDGPRLATALLHALQRSRAEQEAHHHLELSQGLLDAMEAPTCAVDMFSRIVVVNQAWEDSARGRGGDALGSAVGVSYLDVCDRVVAEAGDGDNADGSDAAWVAQGLRRVLNRELPRYQYEYPCHGEYERAWFSVRITPATVDGSPGAVVTHVDVTQMRLLQDVLSHRSMHDALTGLPNRLLLDDRLGQALADTSRTGSHIVVGFLDLDRFKAINDTLGHRAGDELLVEVARRLKEQLRAGDTLCRWSGDEFVVIWRNVTDEAQGVELGERLLEALMTPATVRRSTISVSCSLGIVVSEEGSSSEQLLMAADTAMYDAKARGGGRLTLHTGAMHRVTLERYATEEALRTALSSGQLLARYQPVVDLVTGQVVAVEALCRWQHPTRGLVTPDAFIPVAEATGLVVELGAWMLERACLDAVAMTPSLGALTMAVNVSVRELSERGFVDQVRRALATSGLDPRRLVLEVTESALMQDEARAELVLQEVAALGVRLSIDDFGTGYGSLLYLRRFPVSSLKLDRAFVAGIGTNLNDESICRSVVGLADAVHVDSIAEGVETAQQYAALRDYGCTQAQGYLWSPAVPLALLVEAVQACNRVQLPSDAGARRRRQTGVPADIADQIGAMIAGGASLHTVAAALNQMGNLTPAGVRWTGPAVRRFLAG